MCAHSLVHKIVVPVEVGVYGIEGLTAEQAAERAVDTAWATVRFMVYRYKPVADTVNPLVKSIDVVDPTPKEKETPCPKS